MPDLRVSRQSLQYIYAPVTAVADPTSKPVTMAVALAGTEPASGDFKTAGWEPGTTKARILIGPTSTIGQLAEGTYKVWVKVDDNPEDPVIVAPNHLVIFDTA